MILVRCITRRLHVPQPCWASEKSLLAKLRKKTGYTFTNCKRALELNDSDLTKAEAWLKEQAQQQGWAKATKLEGRQTTQGLIAVALKNNMGALLELNCETDFVARNEMFQNMAENAASTILEYAENKAVNNPLTKIWLDIDQLKQLPATDGKTLGDHLALMIGTLGENATLRRALCLKANNGIHLSGYAHPAGLQKNNVMLGRFGGLVAYRQVVDNEAVDIEEIGRSLCQHVVGLDPKKVGTADDAPAKNADDETCLIHQEYLLDESLVVNEVLVENGIEVVDFKRFECGEMHSSSQQDLELCETCQ